MPSDLTDIGIAEKVRQRRTDLGLTQLQVAEKSGLGLSTIIRIERGDLSQVRTLMLVAEALETTLAELVPKAS